jgi:hypothetical protein
LCGPFGPELSLGPLFGSLADGLADRLEEFVEHVSTILARHAASTKTLDSAATLRTPAVMPTKFLVLSNGRDQAWDALIVSGVAP